MAESIGPVQQRMRELLTAALDNAEITIHDDSYKHAGHAAMKGAAPVESHFRVEVVSSSFEGKSRLDRHRLVNTTLQPLFDAGLHALQIKAQTPSEVAAKAAS
eukprot:TRINITY_DN3710_c0_g1_i1.p1 TRINITY_DN3710_c0_g1~~TRINITY_DN3710_c0_g1_i1.p1  ORF type:complete len:103 (-),score=22.96 TRINITY_DN3710_c0_g1_i1:338-646(-)